MRAAVLGLFVVGAAAAADPVLSFPTAGRPAELQLGVDADADWAKFLNKLFDHFDRDGDSHLSAAEAGRVFPLPLAKGREAAMDFAKLDADRDGKGSRAEVHAFYRAAGFTPMVAVVQPAPAETFVVASALFHQLDRDGDGKLTASELADAPSLLTRFDENEDEVLTASELLATGGCDAKPATGVTLTDGAGTPVRLTWPAGKATLTTSNTFALAGDVLTVPNGRCRIDRPADDPAAGFRTAKGFYLAQFRAAGGGATAKDAFATDPTAQVLAGLFDAADRDGDGKLTAAELEAFFALVEAGVTSRVVVTLTDRGPNLFDWFDADHDGRLTGTELRAGHTFQPVARDAVPRSYRLTVVRGTPGTTFGPVPLGTAARKPTKSAVTAAGPRWFRVMDRNGDGVVSAAEFLGPPARFHQLDANRDGDISTAEASAAAK